MGKADKLLMAVRSLWKNLETKTNFDEIHLYWDYMTYDELQSDLCDVL